MGLKSKTRASKQNRIDMTNRLYAFEYSVRGISLFAPSKFAKAKKSNYTKPKRRKK